MKKILSTLAAIAFGMTAMAQHTFFYETNDPADGTYNIGVDSYTLDACTQYSITVDGTYSIWGSGMWGSTCGAPEPVPVYTSPGITNGTVGFDFEYIFALNSSSHAWCGTLERQTSRMEISLDNGGSWIHPTPDAPGYNPGHAYTYTVTGGGFPIQVRHISQLNSDDYGQLQFSIEPILVDPCDFKPEFEYRQEGCSIKFQDASGFPCNSGFNVIGQSWDFGDGSTSTEVSPTHAYASTNLYEVTYTVWATNGEECCKQVFKKRINAEACDPCEVVIRALNFDLSQAGNTINVQEIGIEGLNVSDLELGYVWDFGDGNTGTGANASHTYADGGTYEVCLTVFYYNEKEGTCCSNKVCVNVVIPEGARGRKANSPSLRAMSSMDEVIELSVYPNPSDGNINITAENDFIDVVLVYDNVGRLAFTYQNDNKSTLKIDLTHLNAGYYTVVAEGLSGKRYTSKIILD